MEDVLDVYTRPYDERFPVVCVDEKSKELHSTPRGEIAVRPGHAKRVDADYERHGTANLFMSVEPLTGHCRVRVTTRRTAADFACELQQLVDVDYPQAERIVLVTDNLNTHTPACLYDRYDPAEARRIARKLEWHYTPEHGSWLNMAELELSVISRQCLQRRIPDQEALCRETKAWETRHNQTARSIRWHFTAEDARTKLRRLYPAINRQD